MAGGMDLGTSGRSAKRPLDTAINLVPFIDLMAVLISFLLLTAVWTQTGRVPARQAGEGGDAVSTSTPVRVQLGSSSLSFSVGGARRELALKRDAAGRVDVTELRARLDEAHHALPAQRELTLSSEDAVRYDDLVHVMDACIGSGFDDVQVTPVD